MVRHATLVSSGKLMLDVASGRGRHSRFFAQQGALVTAVDRDANALQAITSVAGITTECRDLEANAWPYDPGSFDAVLVSNYLWRPTLAALLATVRTGGMLLYETFMDGNERFGKPSRPDFLLRPNELLELVRDGFRVVAYEEGDEVDGNGQTVAVKQKLAAVKR